MGRQFVYIFLKGLKSVWSILILVTLLSVTAVAQNFPVNATSTLVPPYSLYLSDYSSNESSELHTTLLFTDLTEPSLDVQLHIQIKGVGIEIETKTEFVPVSPITLLPAVAEQITGADLSEYLNPNNLNFNGIDKNQFLKTGVLPEGFYQVCVQVKQFGTNTFVSNNSCSFAWLQRNDPPIIISPANNSSVLASDPQQILFQWSPQHTGSPNSSFSTEYTFELFEIWPENGEANNIVQNSPPLFSITQPETSYLYNSDDPALVFGRRYAIRVLAMDESGRDLFKNNGYSQVHEFVYKPSCDVPYIGRAQILNQNEASFSWLKEDGHTEFKFRIRESDNQLAEWFSETIDSTYTIWSHLRPGTTYEYQLMPKCGVDSGDYSTIQSFRTPSVPERNVTCSNYTQVSVSTNSDPLVNAFVNDVFDIGGFDMKLDEVVGANGKYSGKGSVFIPFTQTSFPVSFDNITVNSDREVIAGSAVAITRQVDLIDDPIGNIESICLEKPPKTTTTTEATGQTTGTTEGGEAWMTVNGTTIYVGDTILINGQLTVVTSDTPIEVGDTITVNGVTTVVTKDHIATQSNSSTNNFPSDISKIRHLDKRLKDALEDLIEETEDSIVYYQQAIVQMSLDLEARIVDCGFDRFLVVGDDNEYTGEGLSATFELPKEVLNSRSTSPEILRLKETHTTLYKLDSLRNTKVQLKEIAVSHLPDHRIALLIPPFEDTLKTLPQEDIDYMQRRRSRVIAFGVNVLREWFNEDVYLLENTSGCVDEFPTIDALCFFGKKPIPLLLPPDLKIIKDIKGGANQNNLARYVRGVNSIIQSENNTRDQVYEGIESSFPFGIKKQIGNLSYLIGIDSIIITPDGGRLCASMSFTDPITNRSLLFFGSNIQFNSEGINTNQTSKLHLVSDIQMRVTNGIGLNVIGSDGKTYVSWDCNGFKSMAIHGEFEFCRNWILPEDEEGNINENDERVKATFETEIFDWGDWITRVEFTPFQIKGLEGFGFRVEDAWVDMSELRNPMGIEYPGSYTEADKSLLWQGFYMKNLSVKLPKGLKQNGSERTEFGVSNFIIDPLGISGTVYAENVINISNGSIDGWDFSIDSIGLAIDQNQFVGGGFTGEINVPIFKSHSRMHYAASMVKSGGDLDYIFQVGSTDTLEMSIWSANVSLLPSSYVEVAYINKEFKPKAVLDGNVNIDFNLSKGNKTAFNQISFEGLTVRTEQPYLTLGNWSADVSVENNKPKVGGFPITIDNIGLSYQEGIAKVQLGVNLNLMNSSAQGFSANTTLAVEGKIGKENDRFQCELIKTSISEIGLHASGAGFEFNGTLNLYQEDPTFGKGIRGAVTAIFKPGVNITATAQFGSKDGFRYWYVDGMASLPNGISIFPGFGLYGFGGGAYYHMNRTQTNNVSSGVGGSESGVSYIPDQSKGLGLKASVVIGTYSDPTAFNGDVTFEILFNTNGGISYIGFQGNGYFMRKMDASKDNPPVRAAVDLGYDFDNDVLHGVFEVYVNAGIIRGINQNNLAGQVVLHIDRNDWYIHIGTPSRRIGLNALGLFQLDAYMMAGTVIEGMPPPPSVISEILGDVDLNFMRDENALGQGGGFAFGASVAMSTGDLNFLIFYASFDVGLGFDIMLRDYQGLSCAGRDGPIGIDGWYASGQAYAYFQGKVGISVKVFGTKRKIEILEIGAAVVLQAKLPNPSWFRGTVGGYFSVLGGLIKGNCSFQATLGEECEFVEEGVAVPGLKVISDLSPADGDDSVSVFAIPQAVFNVEIDKVFNYTDINGNERKLKVSLNDFVVLNNGVEVPCDFEWNDAHDVAVLKSYDVLPPNQSLTLRAEVVFEEWKSGGWSPIFDNGEVVKEIRESIFTTGSAPDFIPDNNIAYSYPIKNQVNYYKDLSSSGGVQLVRGQPYLFEQNDNWENKVRFSSVNGVFESSISYNIQKRKLEFNIPKGIINATTYVTQIVKIPTKENKDISSNIANTESELGGSTGVSSTNKSISGTLEHYDEQTILEYSFHSSKYNKFSEKMMSQDYSDGWRFPVIGLQGVHEGGVNMVNDELFDNKELNLNEPEKALIKYSLRLNHPWHYEQLHPLIYMDYPIDQKLFIEWRNVNDQSVIPRNAGIIRQMNADISLENESDGAPSGYTVVVNQMAYYAYRDYLDLRLAAARSYVNGITNSRVSKLMTSPFPNMPSGVYEMDLLYKIPGIEEPVDQFTIKIEIP